MSHQKAIFTVLNYSIDQLLTRPIQDSLWAVEIPAVIERMGSATGARRICIFRYQPCPDSDEEMCISLKCEWTHPLSDPWTSTLAGKSVLFSGLCPDAVTALSNGRPVSLSEGDLPLFRSWHAPKTSRFPLITLPIMEDNRLWGILILEQGPEEQDLSEGEISELRTTCRILGAAIHHQTMVEVYQNPVEYSILGIFLLQDQRITYLNPRFAEIFGYVPSELTDKPFLPLLIAPEDRDIIGEQLSGKTDTAEESGRYSFYGIKKDGTRIVLELFYRRGTFMGQPAVFGSLMDITKTSQAEAALLTGYVRTVVDIDNRKQYEQTLREALDEKSVLIMEIHHRVKNNLQIISGLIRLQARQITNKQALDALHACESQVIAIALVHESLYQSDNLANINARRHIINLANTLIMSHDHAVHIDLDIDVDDISLTMNTAVPASLIINELVINALKYAFAGRPSGKIGISLHREPDNMLALTVMDNGIGMPAGINISEAKSLGLKLVTRLVRDQLRGNITIQSDNGTHFLMYFPEEPAATLRNGSDTGDRNAG